jgi:uncharacterized surface protein with fasciclin (FAS1) repeats
VQNIKQIELVNIELTLNIQKHMNKKIFLYPLMLVLLAFVGTGCNDDTDEPTPDNNTTETNTLVDVARANGFNILVEALERVDLDATLSGTDEFTVFAPTDAAFADLLAELELDSLGQVDDATLTQILLNHVVSGKVLAADLEDGYVSTLADGPESTKISLLVNGTTLNNRAEIGDTDVMADNGVVHVIDQVLTIPNVVTAAIANDNFSTLVAALTREDLDTDFIATLSAEGPFTVFAPTNAAFQDLLDSNDDWNALADIPKETLELVLSYHVIAGQNVTSSEINDGDTPTMFAGGTITINTTNGVVITDGNGGTSEVRVPDVQTSNAVIHAIDAVLIPQS